MFKLCITGDLGFEVWKDIPGYEGLYQASTHGRIRSLSRNTTNGKILKQAKDSNGYLLVSLSKNGKVKKARVHQIIASTFLSNPQNMPIINHKSEVKTENQVWNLEWCTYSYNNSYGSHPVSVSCANSKPVLQYDLQGNLIATHQSTIEIERKFGFDNGNIGKCCNGKYKSAYGYIWKYA